MASSNGINNRRQTDNSYNTTAVNSNNTTDNSRSYLGSGHIEVKDSTFHIGNTSSKARIRTRKELEKLVEEEIGWEILSRQLFIADQDTHRSTILPLDWNEPKYFWITKNTDFTQWKSDANSKALWISGPHDRGMKEVSSHIIGVAKEKAIPVLYFFCSTATAAPGFIATVFAHTMLHLIVSSSSAGKAKLITKAFVQSLLREHIQVRKRLSQFTEDDCPSTAAAKILDASANELHKALMEATKIAKIQELSIIIDGIDITVPEGVVFVHNVYSFVKYMVDANPKFKVLLTSSRNADL
ncbi:hypothetical protein BDD12DRAFT_442016 [Trichophaea hybrida]|nr:hypothetical protein BDD12DRAFT_442016 [Trichophaea hybrida]